MTLEIGFLTGIETRPFQFAKFTHLRAYIPVSCHNNQVERRFHIDLFGIGSHYIVMVYICFIKQKALRYYQ